MSGRQYPVYVFIHGVAVNHVAIAIRPVIVFGKIVFKHMAQHWLEIAQTMCRAKNDLCGHFSLCEFPHLCQRHFQDNEIVRMRTYFKIRD